MVGWCGWGVVGYGRVLWVLGRGRVNRGGDGVVCNRGGQGW